MRNVVYFIEKWPEMHLLKHHSLIRRIELNPATDRWSLSSGATDQSSAAAIYDQACDWLQFPEVRG